MTKRDFFVVYFVSHDKKLNMEFKCSRWNWAIKFLLFDNIVMVEKESWIFFIVVRYSPTFRLFSFRVLIEKKKNKKEASRFCMNTKFIRRSFKNKKSFESFSNYLKLSVWQCRSLTLTFCWTHLNIKFMISVEKIKQLNIFSLILIFNLLQKSIRMQQRIVHKI